MNKEKEVDMTYRFTWDEEPTDEQLFRLMREVGEDVRRESVEIANKTLESVKEGARKDKEAAERFYAQYEQA
ncbi:MAG: hypothetical protein LBD21_08900 [Tannerellaceae bacterium]|nr:hypothetical protein [Tannerellaceae bacterium]